MKGDKKNCLVCQTEFIPKNPKGKFCSTKCRMKNMRAKETEVIVTDKPAQFKHFNIEGFEMAIHQYAPSPTPYGNSGVVHPTSPADNIMPKGLTLAEQLDWRLENIVKIK